MRRRWRRRTGAGSQDEPGAAHHRHQQAQRAERAAHATEHAPGPVLEPLAARRLDALLDLVGGDRDADPPTLVVHLRLDDTPADADADATGRRVANRPAPRPAGP